MPTQAYLRNGGHWRWSFQFSWNIVSIFKSSCVTIPYIAKTKTYSIPNIRNLIARNNCQFSFLIPTKNSTSTPKLSSNCLFHKRNISEVTIHSWNIPKPDRIYRLIFANTTFIHHNNLSSEIRTWTRDIYSARVDFSRPCLQAKESRLHCYSPACIFPSQ